MRVKKFQQYNSSRKEYDYDRIEKDFDHVVDALFDILDEFSELRLSFETACGQVVHLKYEEYVKKDEKYDEFIEALPIMGEFFTINLCFTGFDYEKAILIGGLMESNIQRIIDLNWKFEEFKLNSADNSWASTWLSYRFTRRDNKPLVPIGNPRMVAPLV